MPTAGHKLTPLPFLLSAPSGQRVLGLIKMRLDAAGTTAGGKAGRPELKSERLMGSAQLTSVNITAYVVRERASRHGLVARGAVQSPTNTSRRSSVHTPRSLRAYWLHRSPTQARRIEGHPRSDGHATPWPPITQTQPNRSLLLVSRAERLSKEKSLPTPRVVGSPAARVDDDPEPWRRNRSPSPKPARHSNSSNNP